MSVKYSFHSYLLIIEHCHIEMNVIIIVRSNMHMIIIISYSSHLCDDVIRLFNHYSYGLVCV